MWKDGHSGSPILIAFALIFNYIINCIFYSFIKQRLINGKDPLYQEYCVNYGRTQRLILNWCMLTSFQLFRFQYCGLFGRQQFLARFENRMKYYKRVNRYSLFQITFVYIPTIAASVYNLWYTWYGR